MKVSVAGRYSGFLQFVQIEPGCDLGLNGARIYGRYPPPCCSQQPSVSAFNAALTRRLYA